MSTPSSPSSPWEYKLLTYQLGWKGFNYEEIEQKMNELGQQGWETVSTIAPSFGAGQAIDVAIVFKRSVG